MANDMEFICNGTRNSKWYYHEGSYVRVMDRRTGRVIKYYHPDELDDFHPESDSSVVALLEHRKNSLYSFDVVG